MSDKIIILITKNNSATKIAPLLQPIQDHILMLDEAAWLKQCLVAIAALEEGTTEKIISLLTLMSQIIRSHPDKAEKIYRTILPMLCYEAGKRNNSETLKWALEFYKALAVANAHKDKHEITEADIDATDLESLIDNDELKPIKMRSIIAGIAGAQAAEHIGLRKACEVQLFAILSTAEKKPSEHLYAILHEIILACIIYDLNDMLVMIIDDKKLWRNTNLISNPAHDYLRQPETRILKILELATDHCADATTDTFLNKNSSFTYDKKYLAMLQGVLGKEETEFKSVCRRILDYAKTHEPKLTKFDMAFTTMVYTAIKDSYKSNLLTLLDYLTAEDRSRKLADFLIYAISVNNFVSFTDMLREYGRDLPKERITAVLDDAVKYYETNRSFMQKFLSCDWLKTADERKKVQALAKLKLYLSLQEKKSAQARKFRPTEDELNQLDPNDKLLYEKIIEIQESRKHTNTPHPVKNIETQTHLKSLSDKLNSAAAIKNSLTFSEDGSCTWKFNNDKLIPCVMSCISKYGHVFAAKKSSATEINIRILATLNATPEAAKEFCDEVFALIIKQDKSKDKSASVKKSNITKATDAPPKESLSRKQKKKARKQKIADQNATSPNKTTTPEQTITDTVIPAEIPAEVPSVVAPITELTVVDTIKPMPPVEIKWVFCSALFFSNQTAPIKLPNPLDYSVGPIQQITEGRVLFTPVPN